MNLKLILFFFLRQDLFYQIGLVFAAVTIIVVASFVFCAMLPPIVKIFRTWIWSIKKIYEFSNDWWTKKCEKNLRWIRKGLEKLIKGLERLIAGINSLQRAQNKRTMLKCKENSKNKCN